MIFKTSFFSSFFHCAYLAKIYYELELVDNMIEGMGDESID
jgi:hypothetical protein